MVCKTLCWGTYGHHMEGARNLDLGGEEWLSKEKHSSSEDFWLLLNPVWKDKYLLALGMWEIASPETYSKVPVTASLH